MLVVDIKMPDGCIKCHFAHWTSGTDQFSGCNIVYGKKYAVFNDPEYAQSPANERPDWCPLREVEG